MKKIILKFETYYNCISQQCKSIISSIKLGDNTHILMQLRHGYVPTKHELEKIINVYYSVFDVFFDEGLFRHFIDLYKTMTAYSDQAYINQHTLEIVLAEIIKNEIISEKNFQYFCDKLDFKELDWGLLYILAVNYNRFQISDLIMKNGNYVLHDNDDENMLREVEACIVTGCNNIMSKYLSDGYWPAYEHILKILDTYTQLLDVNSFDFEVYSQFNNMYNHYNNI